MRKSSSNNQLIAKISFNCNFLKKDIAKNINNNTKYFSKHKNNNICQYHHSKESNIDNYTKSSNTKLSNMGNISSMGISISQKNILSKNKNFNKLYDNDDNKKDFLNLNINNNNNSKKRSSVTSTELLPLIQNKKIDRKRNDNENFISHNNIKLNISQINKHINKIKHTNQFRKSNLLSNSDEINNLSQAKISDKIFDISTNIHPQKKKYILNSSSLEINKDNHYNNNNNNSLNNSLKSSSIHNKKNDKENDYFSNNLVKKEHRTSNNKNNKNIIEKTFSNNNENKFFKINESILKINVNEGINKSQLSNNISHNINKILSFAISQTGKNEEGLTKTNQDSFIKIENIFNLSKYSIYGVMDGHGINGHHVSQYIKKRIFEYFTNLNNYDFSLSKRPNDKLNEEQIFEALSNKKYFTIKNFFDKVNNELNNQNFNVNFSGSTCITLFRISNSLIISNIGDSRAILIKEEKNISDKNYLNHKNYKNTKNNEINTNSFKYFSAEQLNIEHKPNLKAEKERIEKSGGEIHKCFDDFEDNEDSPIRAWVKGEEYPGIAMSRSLGDRVAESIGVIHEPDVTLKLLNENSKYFVVASDGIWDFISNEEVMNIINPFYVSNNLQLACETVVKKATNLWIKNDLAIDDITIVICVIDEN